MKSDMTEFIENRDGNVLYSDPIAHVVLPEEPYAHGHIRVFSKEPATSLDELDDEAIDHLFTVANTSASLLFELLEAGGTNVLINEGELFHNHFHIDIIAREENDGLDLSWDAQDLPDATMEDVQDRIKSALITDDTPRKREEPVTDDEPDEIPKDKENYLIRQLNKLP